MQVETAILECIKIEAKTMYRIAKELGIRWDTVSRHIWRLKSEHKVVKYDLNGTIKWAKTL